MKNKTKLVENFYGGSVTFTLEEFIEFMRSLGYTDSQIMSDISKISGKNITVFSMPLSNELNSSNFLKIGSGNLYSNIKPEGQEIDYKRIDALINHANSRFKEEVAARNGMAKIEKQRRIQLLYEIKKQLTSRCNRKKGYWYGMCW